MNSTLDEGQTPILQPVGVPEVMATLLSSTAGISRPGNAVTEHETYIPMINPIAIQGNLIGREEGGPQGVGASDEGVMYTLTKGDVHGVAQQIHYRKSRRAQSVDDHETWVEDDVTNTLNTFDLGDVRAVDVVAQPIPLNTMTMQGRPSDDGRMGSGIGEPGDPCPTLTKAHSHAVAQPVAVDVYNQAIDGDTAATLTQACGGTNTSGPKVMQPIGFDAYNNSVTGDVSKTLDTGQDYHHVPNVMQTMAVRRLTPVECERLQGFPDGYTDIRPNGKDTPDGPRYKALGNSMAVPVMRWIGNRIRNLYE